LATTTIRVSGKTRETLRALAHESGKPMQDVLDDAIELYRRQRIIEQANAAYAELRADPQAWQEELEERAAWEATLGDELKE
jgi:hypothetical protein